MVSENKKTPSQLILRCAETGRPSEAVNSLGPGCGLGCTGGGPAGCLFSGHGQSAKCDCSEHESSAGVGDGTCRLVADLERNMRLTHESRHRALGVRRHDGFILAWLRQVEPEKTQLLAVLGNRIVEREQEVSLRAGTVCGATVAVRIVSEGNDGVEEEGNVVRDPEGRVIVDPEGKRQVRQVDGAGVQAEVEVDGRSDREVPNSRPVIRDARHEALPEAGGSDDVFLGRRDPVVVIEAGTHDGRDRVGIVGGADNHGFGRWGRKRGGCDKGGHESQPFLKVRFHGMCRVAGL